MSLNMLRIAPAILLVSMSFAPAAIVATPAAAASDELLCFDYRLAGGGTETECATRAEYEIECKFIDPDATTEFCKQILGEQKPVNPFAPKGSRGKDKNNNNDQDDEPAPPPPSDGPILEGAAAA